MVENVGTAKREAVQEEQYRYPYHYLPRLDKGGFRFHQVLPWGHEYLSYISHVAEIVSTVGCPSLLDVGCGDGRLAAVMKSRFPDMRVVGLDTSNRAIALAKAMAPHAEFTTGDITRSALFDEPFDCATCIDTIEHINPLAVPGFVAGIRQYLKSGAILIVTVPSTRLELNEKHFQHFTAESLKEALSAQFEVTRLYYLNGSSSLLRTFRTLLTNRVYTVTHPRLLTAFYKYYVRKHLHSDSVHGTRVLAICTAR